LSNCGAGGKYEDEAIELAAAVLEYGESQEFFEHGCIPHYETICRLHLFRFRHASEL
jgi:hypothetical protein